MKFRNALFIFVLSFISINIFAQTPADGVIGDYFKAIGGRDKVAAIKSIVINGTMEVMGANSPSTVTIINGKGYKSEMNFNGQNIVQSITDTGAWMINPFMGSSNATPIPAEQYSAMKDEIYVGGALFNYAKSGAAVSLSGTENINGKPAYKINISKDSVTTTYYIDSATHLLAQKEVTTGGQTATTEKYSNYKQTDAGVMMAFTEEIDVPQGITINYNIDKVQFNMPVDASVFNMPKQ